MATALREASRQPPPRASDRPRVKSWAQYAHVQREYNKGMKDGALGPDDRKLKDARATSLDQLAGHINLCLYEGCLVSLLRDAKTVLLPKEAGASALILWSHVSIDYGTTDGDASSNQFSAEGI